VLVAVTLFLKLAAFLATEGWGTLDTPHMPLLATAAGGGALIPHAPVAKLAVNRAVGKFASEGLGKHTTSLAAMSSLLLDGAGSGVFARAARHGAFAEIAPVA